jgi:cyclophilin family peptidyl-prolyl cis-trans isomerase
MSLRNQRGSENRRNRRSNVGGVSETKISDLDLPGPLKLMGNQKLFLALAAFAGLAMVVSLLWGAISGGSGTTPSNTPMQANEAADAPAETTTPGDQGPNATPVPTVKHYTAAPPMTIDTSKTYTATVNTTAGTMQIELDPKAAPQAVNAFVFLANDGYYNNSEFMELARLKDGSKFYAQAGDPTNTGLGGSGFFVPKETTDLPFDRGAVGMGGNSENSNNGQFFISFVDEPALNGKYTVFGKVTSGLDVLDKLTLLDLTDRGASNTGDKIVSITITES